MSQSEFLAITCNLPTAQEKSRVQGEIGFAFHWLKNWREIFKPISKRSKGNRVITFDSHLKTALSPTHPLKTARQKERHNTASLMNNDNYFRTLCAPSMCVVFIFNAFFCRSPTDNDVKRLNLKSCGERQHMVRYFQFSLLCVFHVGLINLLSFVLRLSTLETSSS